MNAAAIVYTSQTGFTARYAALLAERTGLPCRPLKEAAALPRGCLLYTSRARAWMGRGRR